MAIQNTLIFAPLRRIWDLYSVYNWTRRENDYTNTLQNTKCLQIISKGIAYKHRAQSTDKHTCITKTPHTCERWYEHTHISGSLVWLFESHQQHYHRMINTLSYEMNAHRQIHALRSTLANKQNVNSTQTLSTLPMQKVYIVMRYCILDPKHQPKLYGMKWFLRLKNTKMIAKANEHKRKELRNARLNWKRRGEKTKTHWKTDCERHFSFDHFKWATTSLSSSSVNITIMITRKKICTRDMNTRQTADPNQEPNWSQQSRVIKAHKERDC